jgi:hypothetical protein
MVGPAMTIIANIINWAISSKLMLLKKLMEPPNTDLTKLSVIYFTCFQQV